MKKNDLKDKRFSFFALPQKKEGIPSHIWFAYIRTKLTQDGSQKIKICQLTFFLTHNIICNFVKIN